MIVEINQSPPQQGIQQTSNIKDFEGGQRIKKLTTHDFYKLTKDNQVYVAKVFKVQFRHNFEKQLNILRRLKHPHIIDLVYYQKIDIDRQTIGLWTSDMLLFKNACYGSFSEYITLHGKFSQDIARILFKQILSALKYASEVQPNAIIHPDLLPSSILLDNQRKIKICGWSKQQVVLSNTQKIKNLLFSCCQILILMITSYPPFFKKNNSSDPLFKFLKTSHINKFWQQLQKKVSLKYKNFKFSHEVRQLIQRVFLGQWTTFQQIQQSKWFKLKTPSPQDFNKVLSDMEKDAQQRHSKLMDDRKIRQQKKRQILHDYEAETLVGSSNRSTGQYEFFIQDFYDNYIQSTDVPPCQCSELIRLYDDRPNFIIASLKESLRSFSQNEITLMFGSEFKLTAYSFQKLQNRAFIQMKFQEMDLNEQDVEQNIQIRVKAMIRFCKNHKDNLFAEVNILDSNLSEFYANLVMKFIQNKIKNID